MILCATLVSTGSSASAAEEKNVQLVSGELHTCAVLVSGRVKCWGNNFFGQLGLGYTSQSDPYAVSSPTVVPGLTDVASLVAGYLHTCAVLVSGSVKCWGYNENGELGLGYTGEPVLTPTAVPGLTDVASLVLGAHHTCAVLVSGSVKCWGYNAYGQLGLGYTSDYVSSPTVVPELTDVASLVAGGYHMCAVLVSGSVKCWGHNYSGQLGLGYETSEPVSSPTVVPGLTDVASLVAGGYHMCAVLVSGSVKCWGHNYSGELGLGYTSPSDLYWVSSPTVVPGLTDVASLVAGYAHTCAVLVSGSVKCWGYNAYGQLGLGYTSDYVSSPTVVPGLTDVASLVAGSGHTCAVLVSDSVGCWGQNTNGQLGLGYTSQSVLSPTVVPGVSMQLGRPASSPTIRWVAPGDARARIGIWAPKNIGGTAITGYEYTVDEGLAWASVDASSTASQLVISGLENATSYTVRVRAVNGFGGGASSNAKSFTPRTLAGAPTIVSLTGLSAKIKVELQAQESDGGSPITRYAFSVDGGTWHSWNYGSTGTPQYIRGLRPKVTYWIRLRAYTSAGWGAISEAVSATPSR